MLRMDILMTKAVLGIKEDGRNIKNMTHLNRNCIG
jgi:hypothetical protein